ncbi:tetratricopeptide repeat protein [bacterium]|nr:tetratricopeptide repeat protein [bacterium]
MTGYNIGLILILLVALLILLLVFMGHSRKKRVQRGGTNYIDGIRAFMMGDRNQAIFHLTQTAREDSENTDAYLLLGDLLREQSRLKDAIKIHRSLLARFDLDRPAKLRVYNSLALDYTAANMFKEALRFIDDALTEKRVLWAYKLQQQIYEKQGDYPKAFDILEKIGKITKKPDLKRLAMYKIKMGEEAVQKKDYHQARIIFKEALKIDDHCIPAYLYIGDAYQSEGDSESAIEWWLKLARNCPPEAYLVFDRLEAAFFARNEFEKIIGLYKDLHQKRPEDFKIVQALTRIYDKKGDYEGAIAAIRELGPVLNLPAKIKMLELYAISGKSKKELLDLVAEITEDFRRTDNYFYCANCGRSSEKPLWHCPQCGAWDSYGISCV